MFTWRFLHKVDDADTFLQFDTHRNHPRIALTLGCLRRRRTSRRRHRTFSTRSVSRLLCHSRAKPKRIILPRTRIRTCEEHTSTCAIPTCIAPVRLSVSLRFPGKTVHTQLAIELRCSTPTADCSSRTNPSEDKTTTS